MDRFRVGPSSAGDGTWNDARAGKLGDLMVSQLHPLYTEQTLRANRYTAANQTGVTSSVAFATTYVGLCLSNPLSSGINVVMDKASWTALVAFAAASAIGIMTGYHASTNVVHTTPVTPKNALVNGRDAVAKVDAAATLPVTPTLALILGAGLTGAITTVPTVGPQMVDLEGGLILPPGAFAAFYTSTASGASGFLGSFGWSEVPQ